MATGKKGAKGNKTAHVLNLLTAPGEAAPPPAEEAAEGVPEAAPAASGRPLLPPILDTGAVRVTGQFPRLRQPVSRIFLAKLTHQSRSAPEIIFAGGFQFQNCHFPVQPLPFLHFLV